jgi:ketosteroid isomerase-like protein
MPRLFRVSAIAVLLFTAVLSGASSAQAQDLQALTTASREQLDVIKVLLGQQEAWNRGDIDAFAQSYKDAPDTLVVTHQISHGFAGLVEEYRHDYPNKAAMGTLTFSELEARALDAQFAVVVGKYHLERGRKEGGNADGLFSMVLEKTDKGWKIVLDHTT